MERAAARKRPDRDSSATWRGCATRHRSVNTLNECKHYRGRQPSVKRFVAVSGQGQYSQVSAAQTRRRREYRGNLDVGSGLWRTSHGVVSTCHAKVSGLPSAGSAASLRPSGAGGTRTLHALSERVPSAERKCFSRPQESIAKYRMRVMW